MPYLSTENYHEPKKSAGKIHYVLVSCAIVLSGATFVLYQYFSADNSAKVQAHEGFSTLTKIPDDSKISQQNEVDGIIAGIESYVSLPQSEKPVVGKITNADRLRTEQAFYQKSQNGDIILIYPSNKQVFLVRPAERMLVNSGQLVYAPASSTVLDGALPQGGDSKPGHILTIEVRNGARESGLASRWLRTQKFDKTLFRVTAVTKASQVGYKKSLLIPLTPDAKKFISLLPLSKEENWEVADLPKNEKEAPVDYILIRAK